MFLPIGDTPNPKGFKPWVTWGLIVVNVAIYLGVSLPLSLEAPDPSDPLVGELLASLARDLPPGVSPLALLGSLDAYDLFVFRWGFKPGMADALQLLVSMFLHANVVHLGGNMLFLYIFGDNVEHRLGRIPYLGVYLGTGALATLSFALVSWGSMTPLIGASGAISGVLGIYFWLFKRNKVKVFVMLFPVFVNTILLPARLVLGVYLVVDNLLPFLFGAGSNVAYGAHLGGFLAGLLVALVGERVSWRLPWRDRHWKTASRLRRATPLPQRERTLAALRAALSAEDRASAVQRAAGLSARDVASLRPAETALIARWLRQAGHPVAASNLLRRRLAYGAGDSGLAPVYLELGKARFDQGQSPAAFQHLLAALDADPDPETEAEARRLLSMIHVYQG